MRENHRKQGSDVSEWAGTIDGPSGARSGPEPIASGPYRPSGALRRALGRKEFQEHARRNAAARRLPDLSSLAGAALFVGAAAGFLEVAVLMVQLRWLGVVGLSMLRISRHVWWMVPAVDATMALAIALILGAPALFWAARRAHGPEAARRASLACRWLGMVLGTLLVLGPLLTVRRLHAIAALALALGAGARARRFLVWPADSWRRAARWAGAIAVFGLPAFGYWEWSRVVNAGERAWAGPAPNAGPAAIAHAPNLLWIVMDTVRADHLGLYGYGRPTTPNLERWAREGAVFDQARSAAPWTLPSHMTMLTGLWPFEHGARIDAPYRGASPTVAEHLAAHGYATAGLVANTGMCNAMYGLGRGFDTYVELLCNQEISPGAAVFNSALGSGAMRLGHAAGLPVPAELPQTGRRLAPELIEHAQRWLGGVGRRNRGIPIDQRRPFFLFMNFMDAHSPYVPLPTVEREYWAGPLPVRRQSVPENGWHAIDALAAAAPDRRAEAQRDLDAVARRLTDLYDDCLRGLDAELGRFLDELRGSGRLERTWVVITADHGEQFGEHNVFGHGATLYNQVTHVPLIIIPPLGPAAARATGRDPYALARGRRIDVPVSLRDLAATVSRLLLPGADCPFPGHGLARHWKSIEPVSADPILAQMEEQHFDGEEIQSDLSRTMDSLVDEGHLLIESTRKPPELYDLAADPKNLHNLAGAPEQADRLRRLGRTLDELRGRALRE